jgi:uncharacterized membrane protein
VNGDLIVMIFDGDEMAYTVFNSLKAMRKSQVLGLEDTAIVTKDVGGHPRLRPEPGAIAGLAALLGDLIFRSSEGVVPDGVSPHMDDEFLKTMGAALHNGGSALLFFLHPESLSDRGELLSALRPFRGRIHQTTLPPQTEAWLRGMAMTKVHEHSEGGKSR